MNLDRIRAFTVFLSLWGAAAPAAAQYRRTGLLSWSFDDMTVNSGAGRVHAAQWAQAYAFDLNGPLLNPNLGSMRESFGYSNGANISQAANTGIANQQLTSFAASADFFNTALRRFIRFSPNFSRNYLHQTGEANGGAYVNTVANTAWGLSTGLSLPRLPALSYSRQVNAMRNPSEISPVRLQSTMENKSVSYFLGHVSMSASEQNYRVGDQLGATPPQENNFRRASLDANYYEPKWINLQSLFFRTDVSQNTNNGDTSQKQGTSAFGLLTRKFQTGRWESAINYGADASRDFMRDADTFSQNAGLNSTRPIRAGTLGNSLSVSHSPSGAGQSAGDSLSLNQLLLKGLLGLNLGASGAWSRSLSNTTVSEGLNGRLDLYPSLPRNFFAEARTYGSEVLRGSGGNRVDRYGIGANDRSDTITSTARWDRTDSRYYSGGVRSVSDQLSLEASGRPAAKLYASAGYNLGIVGPNGESGSISHNLHGSLDYGPWRGVSLSASATYVGTGYTASVSTGYNIGKTSLKLSYDHREYRTSSSYSHVSVNLSRML